MPKENPYNAWYWKCEIKGAAKGLLAGKRVAVKDNICVAGVPMANGSRVLEGYVPDVDATVVTRILDAGGIIAGKAACEDLCFSAGSHTCVDRADPQPAQPAHSTGGSSGGSAAAVAAGDVEMALGGDQGGSIRTPSCWCGVYGLKPTWGLVPLTGAMPISYAVDHCGPMCNSTENLAKLLTVIAGQDPLDPRTTIAKKQDYMKALGQGVKGMKIGILKEGFGHPGASDKETDKKVRDAILSFKKLGATVEEVSVPMHRDAPACVDRDHPRRRHRDDDQGQCAGQQLERRLHDLADRRLRARLALAPRRHVRDLQAGAAAGRISQPLLSRPLPRQGPEPEAAGESSPTTPC